MRIQHNIMAMTAYRNYTNNVSAMKKNLEKLSSGYKINRAGDDAAGLAISEKMRAQITGLETAQKNAKDGISLVQTAEGALTEVHDMLNRMVELATQSANGTYDDTTDRYQLQKEMDELRAEIDRIADSSNFNGINLLDGSLEAGKSLGADTKTWTADELVGLLPPESENNNELGVIAGETVVEADGTEDGGAKFDISLKGLDTITASGTGDVFTLKIGNDTLTVTLNNGNNTAEDIADLFQAKYGSEDDAASVKGKDFTITNQNGVLKFSSKSKVDLQAGANVTWSWTPADTGTTSYSLDDGIAAMDMDGGIVAYAAGDPSISPVETGVTVSVGNASATINTKTGVGFQGDVPGALASAAGVTAGNVTLQHTGGNWELKVGSATTGITVAAASATVSGSVLTIDLGSGNKVELTATGLGAAETLSESDFQTAFGTAQTIGTLGVESSTPTPSTSTPSTSTPSTSTPSSSSTAVTANIPAASVSGMTTDYSSATSATVVANGDAAKLNAYFQTGAGSSITVDGKTISLASINLSDGDKITEVLARQIGAAVKAVLDSDTQNTYTDIKVKVGNDSPIAAQNAGDAPPIEITFTKTARQTPTPSGTTGSKYHGVIDSGIQNSDSGKTVLDKAVANTRIDTSKIENLWSDGTQIKIGDKTITIAVGEDSAYTGDDVVNITNLTSDEAKVQALANAANKNNTQFIVGHDGKNITLQQKDASDTEMRSREQIASYLGITTQTYQEGYSKVETSKGLTLQIGDTAKGYNKLTVDIKDCHAAAIGIGDIDISTQEGAQAAVDVIKDAINYVSDVRGTLGATQNRLDHTINNLSVMTENIQDAESTIRDVDVAEEMMAYTKNNILIQSAQAMLAQANQVPQGVLQLLQ